MLSLSKKKGYRITQDKTFEDRLLWMTLGLVLLVWWVFMVVNNR
jgi:hypothetical protein